MKKYLKRLFTLRNTKGYTLVEVIVSTVLLGVLIVGIMFFMAPIFQNVDSNLEIERADRIATTMQQYISKTMKTSMYVKIFTGVSDSDLGSATSALYSDPEFAAMKQLVIDSVAGPSGAGKSLELRCLSLRYKEDTNPRNSDTGLPAYKYILSSETVDTTHYMIDNSLSTPVFSASLYEKMYANVAFTRLEYDLNNDGDNNPATTPKDVMHPGYTYEIKIYDEPGVADASTGNLQFGVSTMLFSGRGTLEFNNMKSLEINSERKFTTYQTTDLGGTGVDENIYIFYVARKHVTA